MEANFALQRLLMDEAGEPRANLSSREKEQVRAICSMRNASRLQRGMSAELRLRAGPACTADRASSVAAMHRCRTV